MIETYDLTNPSKPTIGKDPEAVLDYSENWAAWLAGVNDTLLTVTVAVELPLVLFGAATFDGGVVTAIIGGGVAGRIYRVTFSITTVGGRTDQRSIYLRVWQR